jgi:CheY-like chemotaxis protein
MEKGLTRKVLLLKAEGESLAAALEGRGFEVTIAGFEHEAAELLNRTPFDICLLHARAVGSLAFFESLRATARGAVTPVLAIGGARTLVPDRSSALAAGADSFVDETASPESIADIARMLAGTGEETSDDEDAAVESRMEESSRGLMDEPGPLLEDRRSDVFLDDDVADESESGAVAEALAIAASMASPAHEHQAAPGREEPFVPAGTSLRQFIDQVEQRLRAPSETSSEYAAEAADDFDDLDLAADPVRAGGVSEASEEVAGRDVGVDASSCDGAGVERTGVTPVADAAGGIPLAKGARSHGLLSENPVWELLAAAYPAKVTGALVLERGDDERRVYLERGEPIVAASTVVEDRLVELLLREGRLSDADYRNASEKVGASGRRAGAILVEHGIITARELFPLVRHQYETIIFDSFGWREGTWRWDPSARPTGERILFDLPAPVLIVEGIRSRASDSDVERLIPAGSSPTGIAEGICDLREVDLLPEELEIIEACDGVATTFELATRFAMPGRDLCALLAGMSVLGLVECAGALRAERALPFGRGAGRAVDDQQLARAKLADKLTQVADGSYFEILGISPEASGYEIRKAYRVLHAQFSPERFVRLAQIEELATGLSLVRAVVDEAYEVLRDPAMRESYRQALAREL